MQIVTNVLPKKGEFYEENGKLSVEHVGSAQLLLDAIRFDEGTPLEQHWMRAALLCTGSTVLLTTNKLLIPPQHFAHSAILRVWSVVLVTVITAVKMDSSTVLSHNAMDTVCHNRRIYGELKNVQTIYSIQSQANACFRRSVAV